MSLLRFLGLSGEVKAPPDERGETETVQRIAAQLERLPAEQAKHLASFAYVLARLAHADLEVGAVLQIDQPTGGEVRVGAAEGPEDVDLEQLRAHGI